MREIVETYARVERPGSLPAQGVAVLGDTVHRDGRCIGQWQEIVDLAEPHRVSHGLGARIVPVERGPYRIILREPRS